MLLLLLLMWLITGAAFEILLWNALLAQEGMQLHFVFYFSVALQRTSVILKKRYYTYWDFSDDELGKG